ncbi:MAG: PAS domain S-box protein [Acidobacteriota bacterium]
MINRLLDPTIASTAEEAVEFIANILQSSTEYSIIGEDLDGKILLWNEGARRLYGYEPEELIGKNSSILRTPEDVAAGRPQRMLGEALRDGHWEGTVTRRRKDGSEFTARVTVTPRYDARGAPVGFLLMSRDVSRPQPNEDRQEMKVFDSAIVGSAELDRAVSQLSLLRIAFDTAADAILVTDSDGVMLWVNPAFTTTTGYTAEEAVGKTPRILKSGRHDGAFFRYFWETIRAGRLWRGEFVNRRKDGTIYYDELTVTPVCDANGVVTHFVGIMHDITERKRAQNELYESERRFREMHNNLALVSIMLDCECRLTYCNDYFLQITGWRREEVIGADWVEFFIPPERATGIREAFASLVGWHHTYEILTRSGERRLMQWNNSILRSPTGEVIGTASIGEDITSRALAESELRSSEEKLQTIIRASDDAIVESNIATGEVEWSDRAYVMLGHTRATFQPTLESCRALVHPDDLALYYSTCAKDLARGRPCQVRLRVRHANGSYVPVLARGQLQHENGRVLGAFTDLSMVERADERIREQAALIDQAHDAIVVRDLENRITFWNKGAERLSGWSAGEAMGRRFDDLLHLSTQTFETASKTTLATGTWSGEVEMTTADGRPVVVDSRWTLLRDDDGRPKSIFSIDTDITDRKSLEQQFFRAQRLESLGTVAGGIAHDLNNLLMPILMGVTLLKRLSRDERALKAIGFIESSARRGTELVKQVSMFARGVEGSREPVDLAKVVAEIEEIVASTFPKNIAFVATVPDTLSKVLGDATQLNQILLNLAVNARDAMPAGGEIAITAAETDIDRHYALMRGGATEGRYVVLHITDTGTGMSSEVMERIFEPFFTTKELGKGTGLGLSTAQGIVTSHGGFIEVSSKPGSGSTFRIYLPCHRGVTAATIMAADTTHLPRGNGETILVVDDEASIRGITKETLEAFGYAIVTADDGAHAIAIYARDHTKIAAVLTDMMMPIMDGATLIAALQHINPAVPIIAMSGHVEPSQIARITRGGAIHFLSKPYGAEVILRTLFEVLHG